MEWRYFVIFLCVFTVQCNTMTQSEIEDFTSFLQETSHLDQNLKSKDPEVDYDEDELISENAWEESGKFEGDLILNDRQRRMIVANVVEGLARNGLTDSTKRWPNNEVIYFIQREHFSLDQVEAIQNGIDDLARASCVKFTPYKKGDRDAVVIQGSRRGCFSQVGYQGGYQVLNLSGRHPAGRGCFRHGTIVHELLHSLGFYHMQSSPDRDDYIDVLWENIIDATRHNFRKYNSFAVSDFGVGYDYESVLHYSRKAFSVNGKDTLVPKQRGAGIGQRIGLSQKDTQKLNKMYCDAESDLFLDSDSAKPPVVKKKTSKNKPFQGRGIGYHQGKAVAIHLPAAQTYNLHENSNIDKFNDFSTAKEIDMHPMSIRGFGVAKAINDAMYAMPENNFNNNLNSMKLFTAEDENENLQGLLHRFSNVINNEMNPTDARKLDYDQVNPIEYIPMHLRESVHAFQPQSSKNAYHNDQDTRPKSNDDENIYGSKPKKNTLYKNTKNISPAYISYHDQKLLVHEMQDKYNDKNIAHRHNAASDKFTSKNKESALYNYGTLDNDYKHEPFSDYVYDELPSNIHWESDNPSSTIHSHGLHSPKWFNTNISQRPPYQQVNTKSYLDNR